MSGLAEKVSASQPRSIALHQCGGRASTRRCLNADVNGAYNILRKAVPDAFGNGIEGVVVRPARIALTNGPHGRNVHVA